MKALVVTGSRCFSQIERNRARLKTFAHLNAFCWSVILGSRATAFSHSQDPKRTFQGEHRRAVRSSGLVTMMKYDDNMLKLRPEF